MKKCGLLLTVALVVASCGTGDPSAASTTPAPPTTSSISTTTTTTTLPSTTTSATAPTTTTTTTTTPTTTTTLPPPVYTVQEYGLVPEPALGPSAALGSGCAPGSDTLPDGIWYGWVTKATADSVSFDLACFWPGRNIWPAVSNDAAKIRVVTVADAARIYPGGSGPVAYDDWSANLVSNRPANAPTLPDGYSVWLFVNSGLVTEIAVYDQPMLWARSAAAWPAAMYPGCCDAGTVAPPSPADPWPSEGWPADGFYGLGVMSETAEYVDVEIVRWHSCADRPDLCPEWWDEDNVVVDPDEPTLERRLSLDEGLMVVIKPVLQADDTAIVGDGIAYADLREILADAVATLPADSDLWSFPDDLEPLLEDPDYPFGPIMLDGTESGAVGFRGPGGALLSWASYGSWWWHVLEIRDGEPILYIHAGIIAG
jgi:hypothetical protein